MADRERRKELSHQYGRAASEGGVYRIVNERTGRFLLGSARNLAGARNRFEFSRATGQATSIDPRLRADAVRFGLGCFSFEVLDTIEIAPDRTFDEGADELATLEELWRERLDATRLY